MGGKVHGNLIIIGGAEDKQGAKEILHAAAHECGGENGRMVIIATASLSPKEIGETYRVLFSGLNVGKVQVADIQTRQEADDPAYAQMIMDATGIFFTGGDQLRITSILGGTKSEEGLHDAYLKGALVAGTSAGASVVCSTMITDGLNNDPARKCTLKMAPGLGLLEQVIVDQHFAQRGRLGRLLCGVAENPHTLGVGIDEDTAIHVYPDGHFQVLGANAVTVIDGRSISYSNVSELKPDEILAIANVMLHVLPRGYGYDMKTHTIITPSS
jgi:cyanophycinase